MPPCDDCWHPSTQGGRRLRLEEPEGLLPMSMPALFKGRLSIPAIGAPLFIISVPDLVIAQCKAGVVGAFPALNARPAELLDEWLTRITRTLAEARAADPERKIAPFAVNQIVH